MKKIFNLILLVIISLILISCGDDDDKTPVTPSENKDVITLGKYPQNEVFDQTIILELNKMTADTNGMITYNRNEYYKIIYENVNRYFEVAPINWTKINVNGKTMYITDKIIDQSHFLDMKYFDVSIYPISHKPGVPEGIYANNYQYSDLREYLNDTFYNLAFSNEEKEKLGKISYDNLIDYVYTLSISDLNDAIKLPTLATAYAVAKGCEQIYDTEIENIFNGNSTWWLRTANSGQLWRAAGINFEGTVLESIDCHYDMVGIRPVIILK